MARLTAACLLLLLLTPVGQAYDDPSVDYLAMRERLVPAPVASRIALKQVLSSGDFAYVELFGDVSGKASAAPTLDGQPIRTLMMTLDDGFSVALQADEEIDRLQVGNRIAAIAGVARGGSSPGELVLETWIHEWDLPREPEQTEDEAVTQSHPAVQPPDVRPPVRRPESPRQPTAAPPRLPQPVASDAWQVDAVEVWRNWVLELNPKLTDEQARNIVRWVLHYSQEYDVNHKLIFALIKWESWYNPACVSHAGAIGLMQLMPGTARYLGVNPRNVQQNIQGGTRYLAEQLGTYRDRPNYERVILALACYNAGPNAVKRAGHCVPNIAETQSYVKKVSNTFYELHQAGMP